MSKHPEGARSIDSARDGEDKTMASETRKGWTDAELKEIAHRIACKYGDTLWIALALEEEIFEEFKKLTK